MLKNALEIALTTCPEILNNSWIFQITLDLRELPLIDMRVHSDAVPLAIY
jgi:hypothetical protein